jgi:hypothetical protein
VDLAGGNRIGRVASTSHEESDHRGWIDWAIGSASESTGFGSSGLLIADD